MFKRTVAVLLTAGTLTFAGAGVASADDLFANITAAAAAASADGFLANLTAKAPVSAYKGTLLEVGAGASLDANVSG